MAKINVSLPDELLKDVDALAEELKRSRSGLVQEATAHYVAGVREQQARAQRRLQVEGAMADARALAALVPDGEDTTASIRRDRDADYGSRGPHE
jgi:metal-responsive CopG/Arc/MetJ family transcriptional regulator